MGGAGSTVMASGRGREHCHGLWEGWRALSWLVGGAGSTVMASGRGREHCHG